MRTHIIDRIGQHRLVQLLPPFGGQQDRAVVLTPELFNLVTGWMSNPDSKEAARWGEVYGDLTGFILGNKIALPASPPSNKDSMFAPLAPTEKEIWAYRHQTKRRDKLGPIRIFGRFACRDCFVGLIWRNRRCLPPRSKWEPEKKDTESEWRKLFNPLVGIRREEYPSPPYEEGYYDEYISNYFLVGGPQSASDSAGP